MFHVGQLVLCVDDGPMPNSMRMPGKIYRDSSVGLTRGRIYTVREYPVLVWDGNPNGVRIEEIVRSHDNPVLDKLYGDCPFGHWRFRPLDDSKLDIFRKVLTDKPVEVGA